MIYWLNQLIQGLPEDHDIAPHIDVQLDFLMQLKGLVTKNAPLKPERLFISSILSYHVSDWGAVVVPLKKK